MALLPLYIARRGPSSVCTRTLNRAAHCVRRLGSLKLGTPAVAGATGAGLRSEQRERHPPPALVRPADADGAAGFNPPRHVNGALAGSTVRALDYTLVTTAEPELGGGLHEH